MSERSSPIVSVTFRCRFAYLPVRAIYGTGEPFTGVGGRVKLFMSSTWGRADQQTSRDSNRVWGVLFCGQQLTGTRRSGRRIRAYGTTEPFTGFRGRVRLGLSSTWGRADRQTSQDSNRVRGVLFCARNFPVQRVFAFPSFASPGQLSARFCFC